MILCFVRRLIQWWLCDAIGCSILEKGGTPCPPLFYFIYLPTIEVLPIPNYLATVIQVIANTKIISPELNRTAPASPFFHHSWQMHFFILHHLASPPKPGYPSKPSITLLYRTVKAQPTAHVFLQTLGLGDSRDIQPGLSISYNGSYICVTDTQGNLEFTTSLSRCLYPPFLIQDQYSVSVSDIWSVAQPDNQSVDW